MTTDMWVQVRSLFLLSPEMDRKKFIILWVGEVCLQLAGQTMNSKEQCVKKSSCPNKTTFSAGSRKWIEPSNCTGGRVSAPRVQKCLGLGRIRRIWFLNSHPLPQFSQWGWSTWSGFLALICLKMVSFPFSLCLKFTMVNLILCMYILLWLCSSSDMKGQGRLCWYCFVLVKASPGNCHPLLNVFLL